MLCFCFSVLYFSLVFFFKQKTAYEMRISDWSSDVCSSDLTLGNRVEMGEEAERRDGVDDQRRRPALEEAEYHRRAGHRKHEADQHADHEGDDLVLGDQRAGDRKSTRLNSSH